MSSTLILERDKALSHFGQIPEAPPAVFAGLVNLPRKEKQRCQRCTKKITHKHNPVWFCAASQVTPGQPKGLAYWHYTCLERMTVT